MRTLAARPDGVLVSAETVNDFQLHPGDLLRLRLQDGRTKHFKTVPFPYVGVAKEFPTAPTRLFLVANAGYVASDRQRRRRHLPRPDRGAPPTVARPSAPASGTERQVTDIDNQRKVVGSNLTAVELSGLTKVELGFALLLAAAATGLALGLGFQERRRTFAIASALGAEPSQLGGFIWSEAALRRPPAGSCSARPIAAGISMLVRVLTGVFDPPPDTLSIPGATSPPSSRSPAARWRRRAP